MFVDCGILPCLCYGRSQPADSGQTHARTPTLWDQVAFSVGGSHCKRQLVTEHTHLSRRPGRRTRQHTRTTSLCLPTRHSLQRHTERHTQKRTDAKHRLQDGPETRHDGTWQSDMECLGHFASTVEPSSRSVVGVLLGREKRTGFAVALLLHRQM